jgi:hypothetical protein
MGESFGCFEIITSAGEVSLCEFPETLVAQTERAFLWRNV